MMPSLRFREYVNTANLARQRAQSERNLRAKQILQEIERSYYRLFEIEKWVVDQEQYNRPFAHFQRARCAYVLRHARGHRVPFGRSQPRKTTRARARDP
jgi:hypothetical protein